MDCDCEPQEPDSLFQRCFPALTTTVDNQRPIWSCARMCLFMVAVLRSCVFWFAHQLLLSIIFMQVVVSTPCNSSEITQLSSRAEFGTPCWPSFILSFPRVPSQCGVFTSWMWLCLAKCDCSVHKPMWMQYLNKIWRLCCIFLNLSFPPTFVSSEDSCESWNYFDGRIF